MGINPIGILGGTFDPVHYGHLRLAHEMAQTLHLSGVRFIPAGEPYHRTAARASAAHRLAMTQLAVAGNALFSVDARDTQRSGPTYSYDTLRSLRGELGVQVPLVVLLGADAFALLETWHRWRELFELCHFAVAQRPGAEGWRARLGAQLAQHVSARETGAAQLAQRAAGAVCVIAMTPLDISGTRLREQLQQGLSPRYLLPDSVLDYINTHRLYAKGVNET